LAQSQPTFTVKVVPESAKPGERFTVQINVSGIQANPNGLNGIQGLLSWRPGTAIVTAVRDSTGQGIVCTAKGQMTLLGASCSLSESSTGGQLGFTLQNRTATPVTEGTIIEFSFQVSAGAKNGDKSTFTLESGGALIVSINNRSVLPGQIRIDPPAVFTVGQVTPSCNFALATNGFTANNLNPRAGDLVTINITMTRNAECTLFPALTVTYSDTNQVETITGTLTRTLTHTFANQGNFTAILRLSPDNTQLAVLNFTVAAPPCKPTNVSFSFAPAKPVVNKNVNFKATGTTCTTNGTLTFTWNFGDNTGAVTGQNVEHKFATGRSYTVTLTVRDSGGGTETRTQSITVADRPSCESMRCALRESSSMRRKLTQFVRDNVFPFDAIWEKTNQAINAPGQSLLDKLMELADAMAQDGKDQFDELLGDASGGVEAIRDGVDAATELGDVSLSRARNITDHIDRLMMYLDETLPDTLDAISDSLSELQNAYEEASDALSDPEIGASEAVDALYRARSFLAKARQDVNSIVSTVLSSLSRISRQVLAAERLARRRVGALGSVTLAQASDQSLIFKAQGSSAIRLELHALSGQLSLVKEVRSDELLWLMSHTPALANGVYLARVTATSADTGAVSTRVYKLVLIR
jgi:PKD repeat protein